MMQLSKQLQDVKGSQRSSVRPSPRKQCGTPRKSTPHSNRVMFLAACPLWSGNIVAQTCSKTIIVRRLKWQVPVGCVPPACQPYPVVSQVHVCRGWVFNPLWKGHGTRDTHTPPADRMTERCLWKHYFPATWLAGGINRYITNILVLSEI